jgi:[cytochrome c]-lysine N-methyltransferase
MYVTPSNIIIPGVSDNQSFVKWVDSHKIQLATELSIGQSSLGGIGLYYEKCQEDFLEDLEILRIPNSCKIDYMSLLKLLDELKTRDGTFDEEVKESQFIVHVLTAMEPSTETHILHSYIVAFYLLKQLRQTLKELKYFSESPLIEYDQYLDILCGTYTLGIFRDNDDPFVSRLSKGIRKSQDLYEVLMELLNETYDKYRFEDWLTFEMFYQLQQAIQSRTLEIPHQEKSTEAQEEDNEVKDQDTHTEIDGNLQNLSLEDTSNEVTNSQDEQSDFHVNVTLVPVLDFANHIHNNNAYFDVDKKCDDIILKLKHDTLKEKKIGDKFEVTISYSPVESIQHFINTYGFIPSIVNDTHYQLFELKLPIEEMASNGSLISKWLGVVPQVQIIRGARKSYINLFNNRLPLVFADLTYNPHWNEDLESHFKLFNELPDDYEVDISEVEELVRLQEDGPYDIISGVGPIGLRYDGKVLQDVGELTLSLGDGTNGTVSFDDLVKKCVGQIIHYCLDFLAKGSNDLLEKSHLVLSEYSQYQREVMQNLVDCYDDTNDYNDILLPESLGQTEWEVSFRSLPRQMDIY